MYFSLRIFDFIGIFHHAGTGASHVESEWNVTRITFGNGEGVLVADLGNEAAGRGHGYRGNLSPPVAVHSSETIAIPGQRRLDVINYAIPIALVRCLLDATPK